MGLMDRIRGIFSNSQGEQQVQPRVNEEREKARIADKIISLVSDIKRINTFDSSIWNVSNSTTYQLQRKSLDELNNLETSLENRLLELKNKSQRTNLRQEELETAKWTGQKPQNMSDRDFDRWQSSDDGR